MANNLIYGIPVGNPLQDLTPLSPGATTMRLSQLCPIAICLVFSCGFLHGDIVYQDTFDNDGIATNVGIGGGMASGTSGGLSFVDNGNLSGGSATSGGNRTNASSLNSFDLSEGFTLDVTFLNPVANGDAGGNFPSNHFSIGLATASATSTEEFFSTNSAAPGFTGIGFSMGTRAGNVDQGLIVADGTSYSTLNTVADPETGGATAIDFSLTVNADGSYEYTIGNASGSGSDAGLDLSSEFFFRTRTQGSDGNQIQSVTLNALTAVPEPSSSIVLCVLGSLGWVGRRRR